MVGIPDDEEVVALENARDGQRDLLDDPGDAGEGDDNASS